MSGIVWSDWPTRREATHGADAPGIVRLLSNEPTETERYGHAFGLMALVARAEAREREEGLEHPTYGSGVGPT